RFPNTSAPAILHITAHGAVLTGAFASCRVAAKRTPLDESGGFEASYSRLWCRSANARTVRLRWFCGSVTPLKLHYRRLCGGVINARHNASLSNRR
ncbi:unnamed protein product, partial [Staurois parvus]